MNALRKILLGLLVIYAPLARGQGAPPDCARIVSLAPSITETLYLLELGAQLVANTRYCRYPAEAQKVKKIGGFLDPNFEEIVALEPTIVFLLHEQGEQKRILEQIGVKVVMLDHRSIEGIDQSIVTIGRRCNQSARSETLLQSLHRQVKELTAPIASDEKPRVMVAIGGNEQDGNLSNLYISGNDGYYSDLLRLAGAKNLFERETVSLPMLSREGVIALNPAIIIQIGSDTDGVKIAPQKILEAWSKLDMLDAVKNKRVYIFTQDYASIPSPRYPALLKDFIQAIHPHA